MNHTCVMFSPDVVKCSVDGVRARQPSFFTMFIMCCMKVALQFRVMNSWWHR